LLCRVSAKHTEKIGEQKQFKNILNVVFAPGASRPRTTACGTKKSGLNFWMSIKFWPSTARKRRQTARKIKINFRRKNLKVLNGRKY